MWRNILGHSVYQFTVLAVLTFDGKRILGLTGSDSQAVLNTVIFNSFVFCQVSSCFPSSYLYLTTFFLPLFSLCYEYPRLAHTEKEIIVQLPKTTQKLHLVVVRFMLSVHIQRDNFKWTAIVSMKKRNWNSIWHHVIVHLSVDRMMFVTLSMLSNDENFEMCRGIKSVKIRSCRVAFLKCIFCIHQNTIFIGFPFPCAWSRPKIFVKGEKHAKLGIPGWVGTNFPTLCRFSTNHCRCPFYLPKTYHCLWIYALLSPCLKLS